ncbi:CHAP domain-containing protein [Dyella caseinilytica]|uniref:CHAP domain-containing protein n=1 Tax=Dyella caseinilytica TaxID=1849581 RepID=A0ABX7GT17_9GAMM|nr:CHAP domain-containing protein [Dyella caseinilytica]QRN53415.1 CHAP domain-containing protein [Dyella caseinilytica]GFZ86332.1 hypothetical protein GCM10011408_00880 [Dyella caseinilytica]
MPYDKVGAANYADSHAETGSRRRCAAYARRAIEWGGIQLSTTGSAKDYGPSLLAAGFYEVNTSAFQKGDVAVIQPVAGHDDGHMAIFDGTQWVSDFKQKIGPEGFYPGPEYRSARPAYKIYRHD